MIKIDKPKDAKTKQKLDLAKSTQNLCYMLSPLNSEAQKCLSTIARGYDLDKIQCTLEVELDTECNRPFLKTGYNIYKDKQAGIISYRSPYSAKYFPALQTGVFLSPLVRSMEEKGGVLFDEYAKMYYGPDCVSNFYVEENADEVNFVFCVQNRFEEQDCRGIWNSVNVANISGDPTKSMSYKVTTSAIYEITCTEQSRSFTLGGNLKKTKTESKKLVVDVELDEIHLASIGKIIQENETGLRQQIECIFARKTKELIDKTRVQEGKEGLQQRKNLVKQMMQSSTTKKYKVYQD